MPSFDGTPEKLANYKDEALAYTFTLEIHKRYLAGPRLAQNLSGVAKTVVRRKLSVDPQWLAHPRGAYVLLDFLEQAIEQPTLVQASQYIQRFFFQLKRKKGENMTEWVNRHAECLWEASRALKRVQNEYVLASSTSLHATPSKGARSQASSEDMPWQPSQSRAGQSQPDDLFDERGRLREDDEESWGQHHWSDADWSSNGWWSWKGESWRSAEYQPPQSWEIDVPDFLPDYLAGFLLLQRSGLDAHERANVLAALRGVFSVKSVERALKEQWNDEDLQRRDRTKFQAMVVEDADDEEILAADEQPPDFGDDWQAENAFWAEQQAIDTALAAIQEQKRTLKEARWRQSQVRMGRKFFPPSGGKGASKGSQSLSSARKCLKCGGPHNTDNCPVRKPQAHVADEQAEVAFSAWDKGVTKPSENECEHSYAAQPADLDIPQTIKDGKGVIDCGATATLGSVSALESLMRMNVAKHGKDRVTVDPDHCPIFRFGNNGTKACVSTVSLGVDLGEKSGSLQIHVHDTANQPVLISVKALKALGAVLDFENNEVIYRKVCPKSVVPLEAARNGHLLMPLGGNLLKDARVRKSALGRLADE